MKELRKHSAGKYTGKLPEKTRLLKEVRFKSLELVFMNPTIHIVNRHKVNVTTSSPLDKKALP
uniref:Uncharacterized protein n=1 Tax=Rhizophora mucronata TaxID=61149 RepID=A0A2P2QV58_RHIMU